MLGLWWDGFSLGTRVYFFVVVFIVEREGVDGLVFGGGKMSRGSCLC